MSKIFYKLGKLIEKSPFKVLFISLAIIAIMITGALKVNIATGNDTLVKSSSEAYISNFEMEKEFGGDAMMVLLKGNQNDLLSQENVEKMWKVEERLKYNENIYSFISPASIVHQITDKQSQEIKKNIPTISDGLNEMSKKLIEIGGELKSKDLPNPADLEKKLAELMANMDPESLMEDMLSQQKQEMTQMTDDVEQMTSGLNQMGTKLVEIGSKLGQMDQMDTNVLKTTLAELENVSSQFDNLINGQELLLNGLNEIPEVSEQLKDIPTNTITGLETIQTELTSKVSSIKDNLPETIPADELKNMASGLKTMGEKLIEVSSGLADLPDKITSMTSSLQDPTEIFSGMMSEIENEVATMKANLTGGIDPEELKTMAEGFATMGENLSGLSEGLETFYEKSGMLEPSIPHNQKELDFILYDDFGELKQIFSDTIIDDQHIMMMIKLKGNIDDNTKDAIFAEVSKAMAAEYGENSPKETSSLESFKVFAMEEGLKDGEIEYLISGKPVLDASLRAEMQSNMQFMIIAATLVMTAVLFFIFKVRWSILSIGIILISVIGTLGLMGHLSVSMTMVSMAVFPILIGLGIDFSIQFHNRYEEELSVTTSLTQTGRAIAIAVLASMLGFVSLYASPVPMIQDFGKMLTIGVVVAFLGSIFLLMPILKIRDLYNPKTNKEVHIESNDNEGGLLGGFLGKISKVVSRFAPLVLLLAIAVAGFGLYVDSRVGVETNIESFMPQDMEALEDIRYVRDVVGSTDQMVIYMEDDNMLSENNVTWMQEKAQYIQTKYSAETEDVKSINSLVTNLFDIDDLSYQEYLDVVNDLPSNQRGMFINEDTTKGAIIINIKHMATEDLQDFVAGLNEDLVDAPMKVTVTGKSVLDVEMVKGLTDGRVKMTILGIALVFLGLLLVYRNPFKALIPVLPVLLIVGMSGGAMYLLGFSYTPITATLGALILGMGTETTLMILERYVEERESGKSKAEALDITVRRIGKATLSTELTTMGGFAVLIFSGFVILRDFGLMTVINVSLILVSTFVVLPAVIWIFDGFIIKE